jgi:hypothetical protein
VSWEIECYRDLVLAVFRLAVADFLGIAYGFDGPIPTKAVSYGPHAKDALDFLEGPWAVQLAEAIGIPAARLRRRLMAREGTDRGARRMANDGRDSAA